MKQHQFQTIYSRNVPKLTWIRFTRVALELASALFRVSKKRGRIWPLEACAVGLLRLALRSLGHAPADSYIEFRADLPAEI